MGCNEDDIAGLRAIYDSTGGDQWLTNTGWSSSTNPGSPSDAYSSSYSSSSNVPVHNAALSDCCIGWYGVTCDPRTGRVIYL